LLISITDVFFPFLMVNESCDKMDVTVELHIRYWLC